VGYTRTDNEIGSERVRRIRRILVAILVLNLLVAFAKLAWGLFSNSVAMQADGFHSLFDGTSNIVGLVGLYIASRPADRDHPYGHGKYETYASAAIGAMLMLAAYNVGSSAIRRLIEGGSAAEVTGMSFAIMLGTLAVNLMVTLYERRVGVKLRSEILIADASHTASDVWVSIGVIAGRVAVKLGFPIADPLIALAVAGAITPSAWRVFGQASATLSDSARIPPSDICDIVLTVPGVLGCHHIRTRGSSSEVYVDMHVQVHPALSVDSGHEISENAERAVCAGLSNVVDVIVHLEPLDEYQSEKTAEETDAGLAD
jgi:cation diffusion facilitator family transporter